MKVLIAIQKWDASGFSKPFFATVEKVAIPYICYTLVNVANTQIRLTYPKTEQDDVSRLNGGYFHPTMAAPDQPSTMVKFLVDRTTGIEGVHVYAVFPEIKENVQGTMLACYSHVGQHSSAHIDYIKKCKRATPEQYEPLKRELELLGYNLNVQPST